MIPGEHTLYRSGAKFHLGLVGRTDGRHLRVKSAQEFADIDEANAAQAIARARAQGKLQYRSTT
jgi:hypothetical protein